MEARHAVERRDEGCRSDCGRHRHFGPFAMMDGETRRVGISRSVGFYERRVSMRAPDGRWVELPIPETASLDDVVSGQAIVTLVDPLGTVPAGVGCCLRHCADACRPEARADAGHGAEQEPGDRGGSGQRRCAVDQSARRCLGQIVRAKAPGDGSWARQTMPLASEQHHPHCRRRRASRTSPSPPSRAC